MRTIPLILLACLLAFSGAAQEASMGDYNAISIDRFGLLKANFNGTLERLADGVHITLKSNNPEVKPLPLQAGSMTFEWPEGASTPTAIIMEGDVRIEHPQGTVTAQRAEWNFDKGTLEFSGDPVMSSEMFKEMRGSKMTLNFQTGEIEVSGTGRVSEIQLGAVGGGDTPASPHLLSASDVGNWAGLIDALKEQAAASGASPGKHIVSQLDRQTQAVLTSTPSDRLAEDPSLLVKQLNTVLRKPGLYSAEAWQGVSLSETAQALIAKPERTGDETIQLNRLLLEAAFPQFIKTS